MISRNVNTIRLGDFKVGRGQYPVHGGIAVLRNIVGEFFDQRLSRDALTQLDRYVSGKIRIIA